ncbi:hypothetical protein Anas_04532, partial [Armadillidium nasatum]
SANSGNHIHSGLTDLSNNNSSVVNRTDCSFSRSTAGQSREQLQHSAASFSALESSRAHQLFSGSSMNSFNEAAAAGMSLKMDGSGSTLHSSFHSSRPPVFSSTSPSSSSVASSSFSPTASSSPTAASSSAFFRDEAGSNMAASLVRPSFGQELFQGHMFGASGSHGQGAMNFQGTAQPFYPYGAQSLHPYYMTPR